MTYKEDFGISDSVLYRYVEEGVEWNTNFSRGGFSAAMTNKDHFSWMVCGNKSEFMTDQINNLW